MINIKVIDLKKSYKWISVLLTCIMCIISFRIFIIETNHMIVQAKGLGKLEKFVQADGENQVKNNLFIATLNKAIPMLEVNYKQEYGTDRYGEIIKMALVRLINFDYDDPKTLLKAQLPMLNEMDEDLAEIGYELIAQKDLSYEDKANNLEKNNATDLQENGDLEQKDQLESSKTEGNLNEVPASSTPMIENEALEEKPEQQLPVVISSIKAPSKVKLDMEKPSILIYHTHGTESYLPEDVGNFHSLNRKYTVRAVGEQLKKGLENKGYKIIHDDTLHDYPSYQQSYIRALETLNTNLEKQKSLKIVLDIHRDAAPNTEDARENSYITINNEKVAKFSIVVGTQNPNAKELMIFAEYVKAKSDELYPGLAKKTITKNFKFNQYNSDYYALIEVGNTANHIDEALNTSKYLARILDEVIKDIKE